MDRAAATRKELNSHWEWITSGCQAMSSCIMERARLIFSRAPG